MVMGRSLAATTLIMSALGLAISWPVGVGMTWLVMGRVSASALILCLIVPLLVMPPQVFLYVRLSRRMDATGKALATEKDRYRRLLVESTEGVLVHRNLKPLFANPAAARIGGFHSVEELLRVDSIISVVHPADLPAFLSQLPTQLSLTERIGPLRTRLVRRTGDTALIQFYSSSIEWDGEPARQITLIDITEQDRLNRMRDDFIATVSHELRTPLTSIHGALGLAQEHAKGLPGDVPKLIAIAHDNSERVVRLLNDVLKLERFEANGLTFDRAPVACAPLVRDAVHQNQGLASKLGVTVRIAPDRTVPDIFGDRDALLLVLANLLSNATKFSPAGGTVDVVVAAVNGRVRFSVIDQGPGIAPDFQPHVFERFTQDRAATQRRDGSGLGLSICKRIVEQHGGDIGFDSQPGLRTVFSFSIPERPLIAAAVQPKAATIH